MNIELTLNKMAKKHGFEYSWQQTAFDTRRAIIPCESWNQLEYIRNIFKRINGIKIEDWKCFEGVFEGYVYVMTTEDFDRLKIETSAEMKRHWDWWERYNIADAETKRLMACGEIA